jgi:DNA-binding response OmpR family regulator
MMKVLVVDHKTFLAELVKLALEADGHLCFAAAAIAEASEILRSARIDVVVLDLVIDGHSPLAWIEETILKNPELHGRVFVLADRQLENDEAARLQACGARIIRKPFTLHQMRETVRMMIPGEVKDPHPRSRGPQIET